MTFDEKIILTSIGLGIALLFFLLSYLNERKSLEEVCGFLHQQVLVLPEGATSNEARTAWIGRTSAARARMRSERFDGAVAGRTVQEREDLGHR